MDLLFINKISENKIEFQEKVKAISSSLNINPNWLMFLIDFETSGTFSPAITNKYGCVGLIQFCPDISGGNYKTIGGRKFLMSDIKNMSNTVQLDLVYKYLDERRGRSNFITYYDLYFSILYPKAIAKEDNYVITTGTNPVFDTHKNGKITVGEVKRFLDDRVKKTVPLYYQKEFKKKILFCEEIRK